VLAQHGDTDAAEHPLFSPPHELGGDEQREEECETLIGEVCVVDRDQDADGQDDRNRPHPTAQPPLLAQHRAQPAQPSNDAVGRQECGTERDPHVDQDVAGRCEPFVGVEYSPGQAAAQLNDREVRDRDYREPDV
jgi:hypothetical protein